MRGLILRRHSPWWQCAYHNFQKTFFLSAIWFYHRTKRRPLKNRNDLNIMNKGGSWFLLEYQKSRRGYRWTFCYKTFVRRCPTWRTTSSKCSVQEYLRKEPRKPWLYFITKSPTRSRYKGQTPLQKTTQYSGTIWRFSCRGTSET